MTRVDRVCLHIPAAAADVFAALVDPQSRAAWIAPPGMTATVSDFDARVGGGYRMELRYLDAHGAPGKTTPDTDVALATFHDLVTDRMIRESIVFEGTGDAPMAMTWLIEPLPHGCDVIIEAADVPGSITPEDHEAGLMASLRQLRDWLEHA